MLDADAFAFYVWEKKLFIYRLKEVKKGKHTQWIIKTHGKI